MILTHYIVARRDLTLGDLIAQVAHAAGESFYALSIPGSSERERLGPQGTEEVAGANPAPGATYQIDKTIVVVLGARNEHRLLKLEKELIEGAVAHVAIREIDGPHAGHLMAIGLVPAPKHAVAHRLNEFHMLRQCAPEGTP